MPYTFISIFNGTIKNPNAKDTTYQFINVLDSEGAIGALKINTRELDLAILSELKMGQKVLIQFKPDKANIARVVEINKA